MRRIFPVSLGSAVVALLAVFAARSAAAISITAHVTADNHYGLYHGLADGSGLTLVGRNEVGIDGSPGEYNWSLPETWTFDACGMCSEGGRPTRRILTRFQIGERYPCYYDPADPRKCVLVREYDGLSLLLMTLSIVLAVSGSLGLGWSLGRWRLALRAARDGGVIR